MAAFNEAKHQRDAVGRFTHKPHPETVGVFLGPKTSDDAWAQAWGDLYRPDADRDTLRELLTTPHTDVPDDLLTHQALTAFDLLDAIAVRDRTDPVHVQAHAELERRLRDPNVSGADLEQLAAAETPEKVRLLALEHPNLPAHVIEELAHTPNHHVRQALAKNPSTPSDVLYEYVKEGWAISVDAAQNPNLSAIDTQRAMRTHNPKVVHGLALNPNTPGAVLGVWADTGDEVTVRGVAANPQTPSHVLAALSHSEDSHVVVAVAKNPSTPPEVLDRLGKEDVEGLGIRTYVASNPNVTAETLREVMFAGPREALTNPKMTAEMARELAERAQIWSLPSQIGKPGVLAAFADHPVKEVREGVAANQHAPVEVLQELATDETFTVRRLAKRTLYAHHPDQR